MKDLEQLLRDDARAPVPDHGFTARVIAALPARTHTQRDALTPALVLASAAMGSVLALALAPAGISLLGGFADLVQLRLQTPAAITAMAMAGALLVSALVVAAETD